MLIITSEEKTNIKEYIETIKRNYETKHSRAIPCTRVFDTNTGVSYGAPDDPTAQSLYESFYDYSIAIFRSKIPKSIVDKYVLINKLAEQMHGQELVDGIKACFEEIFGSIYQMFLTDYSDKDASLLTNSFIFGSNILLLNNIEVVFKDRPVPTRCFTGDISNNASSSRDEEFERVVDDIEAGKPAIAQHEIELPLRPQVDILIDEVDIKDGKYKDDSECEEDNKCYIFRFINLFIAPCYDEFKDRIDRARKDAEALRVAEQELHTLSAAARFPRFLISTSEIVEQNAIAQDIVYLISSFIIKESSSFSAEYLASFAADLAKNIALLKKAYGIRKLSTDGSKEMIEVLARTELPILSRISFVVDIARDRLRVDDKIRSDATRRVYESISKITEFHLRSIDNALTRQREAAARVSRLRSKRLALHH